jgi:hypothetical protein
MTLRSNVDRLVAPILVAGFVVACGGKVLGGTVGPGEDSGTIGATDGGGSQCVDLEVAPADISCASDQDCELVRHAKSSRGIEFRRSGSVARECPVASPLA